MKRLSIFIFLVAVMTVSHLFGGIKDKLGLGLNINAHKLYGDTRSGSLGLSGGNLLLQYRLKPALFLEFELGFLRLSTQTNSTSLDTDMLNVGAKAGYTFLTSQIYQPYVYFGIGALNFGKFKYLFEVSPLASFSFWDGYLALGQARNFSLQIFYLSTLRLIFGIPAAMVSMAGSKALAKMVISTWVWALFITLIVTQTRVNRTSRFLNSTLCMLKLPRPMVKKKRALLNRLIRN